MLKNKNIYKTIQSYIPYGFILYGLLFIVSPEVKADSSTGYTEPSTNIKNPETVSPKTKKKISNERGKSLPNINSEAGKARVKSGAEQSNSQSNNENQKQQPANNATDVRPIDRPLSAPIIAPTENTTQPQGSSSNNEGSLMVPTPPSTQNTTIISPPPGAQTLIPTNSESTPMTVPQTLPASPTTPSTILTPPSPASTTPTTIINQPSPP